jgi:hypothetical protein
MHYSNGRGAVINAHQIKRTDKANSKYCFLITPRESERRVQQIGKSKKGGRKMRSSLSLVNPTSEHGIARAFHPLIFRRMHGDTRIDVVCVNALSRG